MVVLTHHGRGLLSHICISGFLRAFKLRYECSVPRFVVILNLLMGTIRRILKAMKPIGELIRERLKDEERSVSWFARKLSCSRANVYKIFRKEYIDTELLTRISRILDYDFFQYFSEHLKEE